MSATCRARSGAETTTGTVTETEIDPEALKVVWRRDRLEHDGRDRHADRRDRPGERRDRHGQRRDRPQEFRDRDGERRDRHEPRRDRPDERRDRHEERKDRPVERGSRDERETAGRKPDSDRKRERERELPRHRDHERSAKTQKTTKESSVQPRDIDFDADISPEEMQMMQSMGIPFLFDTTQGKQVEDDAANAGAVKAKETRQARQYMNRRGGFNRPLPSEATGEKVTAS